MSRSVLGVYRKHGTEFSSQLSFYNFLLTGVWQEVRIPDAPLYDVLGNIYLHANHDTIEIQHPTAHPFCQSLELKDYAQATHTGILDSLLFPDIGQIKPYRFIETQTFCFLSKREGQDPRTAAEAAPRLRGCRFLSDCGNDRSH